MKLTEIQIDCHGIWRNLTLPVRANGLSVFYGPNEAGKTTLWKFIRGVLFGFSARGGQDHLAVEGRFSAAGSLQIEDASGIRRIHRAAVAGSAPEARLITDEAAVPSPQQGLVGEIDEQLFDRIFAVDLRELCEINSLSGDDVARHLFGLSLGSRGQQIVEAKRRIADHRAKLIDPVQQTGELLELFEQHTERTARLGELASWRDRHAEWSLRRDQLEREIADVRARHAGTGEQLRGHVFLERAWGPWNRIRECRHELDGLPEVVDFPERGIERLERIDSAIAAAAECRDSLVTEARQLRNELLHPAEGTLSRRHAAAMQGFVEQRGWLAGHRQQRDAAQHKTDECQLEFEAGCKQLGADWSATRVETNDVSAAAERRLSGTAESFRAAVARRKAILRRSRRLTKVCCQLKEGLAESLHDLAGNSIDEALARARARIAQIDQLAALKLRERELSQRLAGLEHEQERIAPHLSLPRWVHVVLGVFAFMGVILAGWGLVAGVATSGIAGTIYAMLGITCGGLAWGLKIQYEGDAGNRLATVAAAVSTARLEISSVHSAISLLKNGDRLRAADKTLEETGCCEVPVPLFQRAAIGELTGELTGGAALGDRADGDMAEQVSEAQNHIAELIQMTASQGRLRTLRRKRAGLRKKLHTAHLEVGTARQNWNDLLSKIGFPQTLSVDEALASWQLLSEAADRLKTWREAARELQLVDGIWESYRQRIAELARRLESGARETSEPLDLVDQWEEQLVTIDRRRDNRRETRTKLRLKQREAGEYRRQVEDIKLKRNALLMQGGAASRDEFEDRARAFARRTFLADQLHDAEHDLDAACATHTDLALVEEDLERFEATQNSECIETLRMELADLDRDLERAFEHLGGVKREIDRIENDSQATQLRFDLAQLAARLRALVSEWVVCESAAQIIDKVRHDFERRHQPEALADAAKMFSRLTCGKYPRVWAPLGERRLLVSDDQGRSFPVQSLSRGTCEQLLLAVRLAVVRELSRQGISLPVMLDDVIVNFDAERARAAVELLLELAAQGQQILFFTCQKHLADLFATHGVDPVHLPGYTPGYTPGHADPGAGRDERRDEQRLAG